MKFSGVNLLDELAREDMHELRGLIGARTFPGGSIIFTPDTEENLVFIVSRGRVRIYLAYEDKEFTLGILNPGDVYSTHSDCYVQALDDAELLLTNVRSVKRIMDTMPDFTRTMVRVLGHILKNSFLIIGGLAFKDIYTRLMEFLLAEARHSGVKREDGVLVTLDLTIEQLAQLMGATRQTVSTLLGDMARAGLVLKQARRVYLIPDMAALEKAALADS
ncbi:Crp/Fnr family transcriptional regulator [Pseudodesulfovibrio sp.]|uniref:Crp/Fnr family transcriptional regulator n=1 Tax=Pseudodesulfovibrio sp. TaxID=2035812 RepID=UPI00263551DD|nr:Crp/Fnr family transcriptional regulator [Pseudodesulfovibrio sp.]MDD3311046.1 Crp/Fnr family transcriptional regulator [Pseudodesulfovibrio sp.]